MKDRCSKCGDAMRPNPTGEHLFGCDPHKVWAKKVADFVKHRWGVDIGGFWLDSQFKQAMEEAANTAVTKE